MFRKISFNENKIEDITSLSKALEVNSCLEELYLSGNNIKDITPLCKALEVNNTLKILILNGNKISEEDKEKLMEITELKNIEIFI